TCANWSLQRARTNPDPRLSRGSSGHRPMLGISRRRPAHAARTLYSLLMHRTFFSLAIAAAIATASSTSGSGQVPTAELARPPADARHYVIQSTGGKHGDSWRWVAPDGARMGRESMNLRGQVFEIDSSGKAGTDGLPSAITIRGVTPQGDAAETFTISGGTAVWKSQ